SKRSAATFTRRSTGWIPRRRGSSSEEGGGRRRKRDRKKGATAKTAQARKQGTGKNGATERGGQLPQRAAKGPEPPTLPDSSGRFAIRNPGAVFSVAL